MYHNPGTVGCWAIHTLSITLNPRPKWQTVKSPASLNLPNDKSTSGWTSSHLGSPKLPQTLLLLVLRHLFSTGERAWGMMIGLRSGRRNGICPAGLRPRLQPLTHTEARNFYQLPWPVIMEGFFIRWPLSVQLASSATVGICLPTGAILPHVLFYFEHKSCCMGCVNIIMCFDWLDITN